MDQLAILQRAKEAASRPLIGEALGKAIRDTGTVGIGSGRIQEALKNFPVGGLGSRVQETIRNFPVGGLDPKITQQYASAQALIKEALGESKRSQESLREAIAAQQAVRSLPSLVEEEARTRLIDATIRVEVAVQRVGEVMDNMLVVSSSLLTISEQSMYAQAASDRTLRWLTGALVFLTVVLALPVFADFWNEWLVPWYGLLFRMAGGDGA